MKLLRSIVCDDCKQRFGFIEICFEYYFLLKRIDVQFCYHTYNFFYVPFIRKIRYFNKPSNRYWMKLFREFKEIFECRRAIMEFEDKLKGEVKVRKSFEEMLKPFGMTSDDTPGVNPGDRPPNDGNGN